MRNFLIAILISNLVYAEEPVVFLEKGAEAPYAGFLFTEEKARELRVINLERDHYKLTTESLQKSLELQKVLSASTENKVAILLEQNDRLAGRLYDAKSMSDWERIFWFGLGIVGMGFGLYGLKNLTQ